MIRQGLQLCFLAVWVLTSANAADLRLDDQGFIHDWLIGGPFPSYWIDGQPRGFSDDFLLSLGGEAAAEPRSGLHDEVDFVADKAKLIAGIGSTNEWGYTETEKIAAQQKDLRAAQAEAAGLSRETLTLEGRRTQLYEAIEAAYRAQRARLSSHPQPVDEPLGAASVVRCRTCLNGDQWWIGAGNSPEDHAQGYTPPAPNSMTPGILPMLGMNPYFRTRCYPVALADPKNFYGKLKPVPGWEDYPFNPLVCAKQLWFRTQLEFDETASQQATTLAGEYVNGTLKVLAHIENPSTAKTWKPPEVAAYVSESLLDIPFTEMGQLRGKRLPIWAVIAAAPDGRPSLKIEVDAATSEQSKGVNNLVFGLPGDAVAGHRIDCAVRVKAGSIAGDPAHKVGGGKFTLHYQADGKSRWADAIIGYGSFDWKEVHFEVAIPKGASNVFLCLGLQRATGTIYFRDLRITKLIEKQ